MPNLNIPNRCTICNKRLKREQLGLAIDNLRAVHLDEQMCIPAHPNHPKEVQKRGYRLRLVPASLQFKEFMGTLREIYSDEQMKGLERLIGRPFSIRATPEIALFMTRHAQIHQSDSVMETARMLLDWVIDHYDHNEFDDTLTVNWEKPKERERIDWQPTPEPPPKPDKPKPKPKPKKKEDTFRL